MVSGDIKVAMRASIGIKVTKAIAKCVLSISKKTKRMSSNNDYDYTEREKKVLELCDSGKSTRDIAKILRMSLRDISFKCCYCLTYFFSPCSPCCSFAAAVSYKEGDN